MEGVAATNFWLISVEVLSTNTRRTNQQQSAAGERLRMFIGTGRANTNKANILLNVDSNQQNTASNVVIRTNSPVAIGTNADARKAPVSAQKTNPPSGSGIDILPYRGILGSKILIF